MMHLLDYRRDVQSNMTVCGLVVGDDFIGEVIETPSEDICPNCSQLQFRRDEPENEVGIPEGTGHDDLIVKQERYGD